MDIEKALRAAIDQFVFVNDIAPTVIYLGDSEFLALVQAWKASGYLNGMTYMGIDVVRVCSESYLQVGRKL